MYGGFFVVYGLFAFCIRLFLGGVVVCAICLLPAFIFFLLLFFTFLSLLSEANSWQVRSYLLALLLQSHTVQGTKSFLMFYCLVERLKTELTQINFNFEESLVIF